MLLICVHNSTSLYIRYLCIFYIYIYWFEVILMNVVFVGKDQGQRPSRKEKGGAAETAG